MFAENSIPKTAFLPANIWQSLDACALMRMFLPHLHTPNSMFLFREDRLRIEELKGNEVIVVQRQITQANRLAMQMLRAEGFKIIYDSDDNLFDLPSYNPAKKAFESMQDGFAFCIKEAHIVTVSTRGLKTAIQSHFPGLKAEILIVPNSLDYNIITPTQLTKEDGKILIGWGGSNTHSGDLEEMGNVLPKTLQKYRNVHLQFVGMIPDQMRGLERVGFRPWIPVSEWQSRYPNFAWDISLAPLQDNRFNKSKSGLKLLEAAAIKIPCLASDVQPYREFCSLGGKELEWLLCSFPSQWEQKLDRLINDPLYRNYLGDLMHQTARKYFDISKNKDLWFHALRSAMSCS